MSVARQRVVRAQTQADRAQHALVTGTKPWRLRTDAQRAALCAGSGLATGLALTLLPLTFWRRAGGLAFSAAARLARSSALPPALLLRALIDKYAK